MARPNSIQLTRRDMLKLSSAGAGVFALTASGFAVPRGFAGGGGGGGSLYLEAFPTSPLILNPFSDNNALPIPTALKPAEMGTMDSWVNPKKLTDPKGDPVFPQDPGKQDCGVGADASGNVDPGYKFGNKYHYTLGSQSVTPEKLGLPKAIVYKIDVEVATHRFTDSQVLQKKKIYQKT